MTNGLEYLGRARMQGLILLVLAFLVGVLAGVAGDRLMSRPRPPEPRPEGPRGRERLPKVLEDMDLTPAQRSAIDSILASGRPRNEAIMREVLPRLLAVSDSLHQGIRAVLTPAQVAEFNAYLRAHPPRLPGQPQPREGSDGAPGSGAPDGRQPGEEPRERRPPPRDDLGGPPGGYPPGHVQPDDRRPPPPPGGDPHGRRPPPPPPDSIPPPPSDRNH